MHINDDLCGLRQNAHVWLCKPSECTHVQCLSSLRTVTSQPGCASYRVRGKKDAKTRCACAEDMQTQGAGRIAPNQLLQVHGPKVPSISRLTKFPTLVMIEARRDQKIFGTFGHHAWNERSAKYSESPLILGSIKCSGAQDRHEHTGYFLRINVSSSDL